jgi:hypothetical protein
MAPSNNQVFPRRTFCFLDKRHCLCLYVVHLHRVSLCFSFAPPDGTVIRRTCPAAGFSISRAPNALAVHFPSGPNQRRYFRHMLAPDFCRTLNCFAAAGRYCRWGSVAGRIVAFVGQSNAAWHAFVAIQLSHPPDGLCSPRHAHQIPCQHVPQPPPCNKVR